MSYSLSSDLNLQLQPIAIAPTATVANSNTSAFTPNAMFAHASHKQHGLFMASTPAELNSSDAGSKGLVAVSGPSPAAAAASGSSVVVDRETLAQVQHFHQQQTQQLQHQVAVQQQTILQFQQQQQRQQQEQQHLYAAFQPQQPQMAPVMQPFPTATMASPINNYAAPMATPLHLTPRLSGPGPMYPSTSYSSFPVPHNHQPQYTQVNQNFNTNISMTPNPNMNMQATTYPNNGMLVQQAASTAFASSTPTYALPMATPMAGMVPNPAGADLNGNTVYPVATTGRPAPSPASTSMPNSQFRLLQSIQLQQELDQQRFGQHTWISSLFHDREGKPLKQPSSLLPPPLCTPSHPGAPLHGGVMTPSTPVAAIPAYAVGAPVAVNTIPVAAMIAAPTPLATITAASSASAIAAAAAAAAAVVPNMSMSSPALSSTAADYDHSNSLLALTMVAHQDEELSASTASSTPKQSNRKRKADSNSKRSSEEAEMLSSLANDANDSSDASRSVSRESKRKKTSNKSVQLAASKNASSSSAQPKQQQPVQTKPFSFSKANLQLHAKTLAKASEPIVQYHPNSHHVANRSKKKKSKGDEDEEDEEGDEEGATPSSRSRYCLPCPLILTLPKVPLQTLYLQVQRQYTISKKEMEARKMSQSQREELVCVPVRIMGSPSDLSQLYFVAKDVCLLIFIRKGNVAKQIGQFATHEKARLPVLCPRSNGTSSTHVLTALSLAGLKRLLGGSKSPLAPHVLKFLLNHLKSLSTLVKENKSDPKLAQSFHATLTKNGKSKKVTTAAAQQEDDVDEESEEDVVTPAADSEEAAEEEVEEEEEEELAEEEEEEESYSSEAIALPQSSGPAFPLMSQLPAPGVPLRGKGKGVQKSAPKIVATITPQSITIVGSGELATKIVMD